MREEALEEQNFNAVSIFLFKLRGSSNNLMFYAQSVEPAFSKHSLTKKASLSPMGKCSTDFIFALESSVELDCKKKIVKSHSWPNGTCSLPDLVPQAMRTCTFCARQRSQICTKTVVVLNAILTPLTQLLKPHAFTNAKKSRSVSVYDRMHFN